MASSGLYSFNTHYLCLFIDTTIFTLHTFSISPAYQISDDIGNGESSSDRDNDRLRLSVDGDKKRRLKKSVLKRRVDNVVLVNRKNLFMNKMVELILMITGP